jgi:hypothetical protein
MVCARDRQQRPTLFETGIIEHTGSGMQSYACADVHAYALSDALSDAIADTQPDHTHSHAPGNHN